jgi:hypothetical protein
LKGVLGFLGFKVEGRVVAGGMANLDSAISSQSIMDKAYAAGVGLIK